ncbi:unnamed protein product [Effrenium voratum]|nr:unnamed protein product [Effrenium voratum]
MFGAKGEAEGEQSPQALPAVDGQLQAFLRQISQRPLGSKRNFSMLCAQPATLEWDFSVMANQKHILSRMSGRARPGEAQTEEGGICRLGIPLDVTEEELMDIADDIVQQQVPDQADLVVFKETLRGSLQARCQAAPHQCLRPPRWRVHVRPRAGRSGAPLGATAGCGEGAVAPWEQAARLHAELRRRGGPAPLLTDFGDLQDDLVLLQSWAFELSEKQRSFLGL